MNNDFKGKVREKREREKLEAQTKAQQDAQLDAVSLSSEKLVKAIENNEPRVEVKNPDLAKTSDVQGVVDSINKLNITAFMSNRDSLESWGELVTNLSSLSNRLNTTVANLKAESSKTDLLFEAAVKKLDSTVSKLKTINVEADADQTSVLKEISSALSKLEINPVVNVAAPKVEVSEREVDFTPLVTILTNLDESIKSIREDKTEIDMSPVEDGLTQVEKAIRDLIDKPIPVPSTPSPFRNSSNQGVQALVSDSGGLISRGSNLSDLVDGTATNTDGTSSAVITAKGAGIKTYLTDVTLANTSASNIFVELKDGSTSRWVLPVPANGGVTHRFESPLAGTANTAWNFDPSAAATTIYCSLAGFTSNT